MSAFKSDNFSAEFILRTQLNYYRMLLIEHEANDDKEKINETNCKLNKIQKTMQDKGFRLLDFCCGTQLMNSILGLLVIPQQEMFENIATSPHYSSWYDCGLYTLSKYVLSNNEKLYKNTYKYYHRDSHSYRDEANSPRNVLTHMRNAVSHKRLMFYPESPEGQDQVTHVVFKDMREGKHKCYYECEEFYLKICIEDLENLLFEISNYFVNL